MTNNWPDRAALYEACRQPILTQIATVEAALQRLDADKAAETKSSAGDKYETGRAMLQREEAQLAQQRARLLDTLAQLDRAHQRPLRRLATVGVGSLVRTPQGLYWIAAAIGRVPFGEWSVFCISPASPIGALLLGREAGAVVTFNGRPLTIQAVDR